MSALVRTLCISLFWNGIYDMILCRDPHRIVVHKRELTFELLKSTGYCSLIKTTSDFFCYVEWAPSCSAGQTGCTDWVCLHCLEFVCLLQSLLGVEMGCRHVLSMQSQLIPIAMDTCRRQCMLQLLGKFWLKPLVKVAKFKSVQVGPTNFTQTSAGTRV